MAIKGKTEEPVEWNVDMEVQLFYAMRGHKPVGVNKHFQMACVLEKFRNSIQKDVASQQIWDHLESMYDMAALHESEIVPFPNEELEFALPDSDFGNLLRRENIKREDEKSVKSRESSSDERDSSTTSGKQTMRDRLKEVRDDDSMDSSLKRKRATRQTQPEQGSKPSSPASSGVPIHKRRRT